MELSVSLLQAPKLWQWVGIGVAVIAVAVADVLLKKATAYGDLAQAVRSPWLWGAVVLYLVQVAYTLLMLVSAFAGREKILHTYETAIKEGYRFYSFGDAMLIL